jgi:hypothetical protein
MFKKTVNKPFQVKGIIEDIKKGEEQKGAYLGNDSYNVYTLTVDKKEYTCNVSVNEKFDFKVGDDIFFRAKKYDKSVQIEKRSLGINVPLPQDHQITLSDEMLRKLQERSDSIKNDDKQPVARATPTKFKP